MLRRKKRLWTRDLRTATSARQIERAVSKYRHKQIKSALVEMFRGKCAYCESKILHVDYAHIEHFRPKANAAFWGLVFEWENLFLSCAVCNGPSFKGDRFPDAASGGPPINPCDDLPDAHLAFNFDPVTKVSTVCPRTARGKITVDLFGLNRPDLREYRSRILAMIFALSRFATTDEEARRLLEQARSDGGEYAAFARSMPA